jgi:hypothetical protein
MQVSDAFDIFQGNVDADAGHVRKARHRRDIFSGAFKKLTDVTEVIPSGSLARGTQLDPIHDVDLIVVFDAVAHPDWGRMGSSAEAALTYAQAQVRALLGDQSSIVKKVVGETKLRNHVIKCFLDPEFMANDPDFKGSFAVEVMPALRSGDALLVPERKNEDWQTVDPEWLIAEVRRRQERWRYFVRMIRVVKFWTHHVESGMKPLAAEVLALKCLPDALADLSRPVALQRFFTAASSAVMLAVTDPAGHCGEIQPDLPRIQVHDLLKEAADIAAIALAWEQQGEDHKAICYWRTIFGEAFPVPPGGCPGFGREDGGDGGGDPSPGNGGAGRDHTPRSDEHDSSGSPIAEGSGSRHRSGGPRDGADSPRTDDPPGGDSPGDGRDGGDRHPPPPGIPFVPPSPARPVRDIPQG